MSSKQSLITAFALAAFILLPRAVCADAPAKTPLEEFIALSEADSDAWTLSYDLGGLSHNNSHRAPGVEQVELEGGALIPFTPHAGLGLEFGQDASWYRPKYLFGGNPQVPRLFTTTLGEELIWLPDSTIALEFGSEEYLSTDWNEALNSDDIFSDQTAAVHYLLSPDFGIRAGVYRYEYWRTHVEPLFGIEWRSADHTMHATLDAPLDGKFTRRLNNKTEWYLEFSDDITEYHVQNTGKLSLFDSRASTGLRWYLTDVLTLSVEYGLTIREQRKVRLDGGPTKRDTQYGISDIGLKLGLAFD